MKPEPKDFPYFQLSTHQDLILFLIRNELLGMRFINQLSAVGFDTSFFSIELGTAILSLMGFTNRTDTLWEWYYKVSDMYATRVDLNNHITAREAALDFYAALRTKLQSHQK